MKNKEKRGKERLDLDLDIYGQDGELLGHVKDISSGGCFIETKKDIAKDKETLNVSIVVPDSHHKIDVECRIRRNVKDGIGTEIIMNEYNRSLFAQFLDSLSMFRRITRSEREK